MTYLYNRTNLLLVSFVVLLSLLAYLIYPSTAHAALARVQASSGVNTTFASSVQTGAFGSALTNPSLIICAVEIDTGAVNAANTPTDTALNTYTRVLSKNETGVFDLEIWYALNTHTTASNKTTITDASGGVDSVAACEEWTGAATVSPVDQSTSANDAAVPSTALASGNTAATTNANDVVWGAGAAAISGNHLSLGATYSNLTQNSTTFSNLGIESKTVSATGAQSAAMTVSSAVSWVMGVVAFKQAGAAAVTTFAPWQFSDF